MESNSTAAQISDVLAVTNNLIASFSSQITLFLGAITLFTLIFTAIIQIWLAREKKKEIEAAIKNIVEDIAQNDQFRDEFIKSILKNDDFKSSFNSLIDISVNDKMDGKIQDYFDNFGEDNDEK